MVRIRAYRLVLSLSILLAVGSVGWAFANTKGGDDADWWLFGAAIAFQAVLSLAIACPRCGKSPYAIGPYKGAVSFFGKPLPDTVCTKCGFDLRGT